MDAERVCGLEKGASEAPGASRAFNENGVDMTLCALANDEFDETERRERRGLPGGRIACILIEWLVISGVIIVEVE